MKNTAITILSVLGLALCSTSAYAQRCDSNADCDDGVFCNGRELCIFFGRCAVAPFSGCSFSAGCDEKRNVCLSGCVTDSDCPAGAVCNGDVCSFGCVDDSECDDGVFCNGPEYCIPDLPRADEQGCVSALPPCLNTQICQEETKECVLICPNPDQDGDGFARIECGGSDCDDTDARRNPGNLEVCDAENKDEDCDFRTFGDQDADGDGFVDARCCNVHPDTGEEFCGTDCSDSLRIINPGRLDICDGFDNDCNGFIDDGVRIRLYPDKDGDGFGDAGAMSISGCPGEDGFSTRAGDCDDTNPAIIPGAMVCEADGKETVLVCQPTGLFTASTCPIITDSVCVTLPNGTADCEPRKCIANDPPPTPTD